MLGNLDCSVNLSFVPTFGLNLNKCLPFSDTSHCLCHFAIHDSRAPFRISIIDEISSVSSIFSASSAASFASISATSFPCMLACPGVQSICITMSFVLKYSISSFMFCIVCLYVRVAPVSGKDVQV